MSYFPETNWQIIIPTEAENLVANPSVENDTTGYTADSATISRVNTDQKWGAYSLKVQTTDDTQGFYYTHTDLVLASGTAYNVSFYANIPDGITMLAYIATSAGVIQESFSFQSTGYWQRFSFPHTAKSSGQKRIGIRIGDNTPTSPFSTTWYVDGLMVVSGTNDQTYIDGDQDGCEWNGAQHASTSTRDDSHRLGGLIYNLSHYGLGLKQQTGIGMVVPTHITQEYGNQDGAIYQGTINRPRVFQLTTQIVTSGSLANLHIARAAIIDALKINLVGQQSELLLRYTGGNTVREIKVLYDAGMEFNATDVYNEVLPLRFIANDPYWYGEGESATGLTSAVTISGAYVSQRSKDGVWSHLNSSFNGQVLAVAYDEKHNLYYFGGSFSGPQSRISKYNPDTGAFSTLGVGDTGAADGLVYALWVDQTTSDVYAGGTFTGMGGIARTKGIARWDYATQAWKPVASGILNGQVLTITQGNDRTVYIGGSFTLMSGVANTAYIAKYSPTTNTVSAMGTGMDLNVFDIDISPDGYPYAIGYFLNSNGVTTNGLAKWTGSTFAAVGSGLHNSSPTGQALAFGKDGSLFGSVATNIQQGSDTLSGAARWNGNQWLAIGTGFTVGPYVWKRDKRGLIYAGGIITTAGGLTLPSPVAIWNGSQWFPIGLKSSNMGSDTAYDLHIRNNDILTVVFSNPNVTLTEAVTTVTNDGSADVYPRIVIDGPSSGTATLYFIKNYTTGDTIYFNTALTINAGERMILDLAQNGKAFTSTFQGNIMSKIVPGSNIGKFRLISGDNKISFFSSSTGLTINVIYQDRYLSADGGARVA